MTIAGARELEPPPPKWGPCLIYNGGLGAEPPAGSRGRAPGKGAKPPWSW